MHLNYYNKPGKSLQQYLFDLKKMLLNNEIRVMMIVNILTESKVKWKYTVSQKKIYRIGRRVGTILKHLINLYSMCVAAL
jgi:hypothetical protein